MRWEGPWSARPGRPLRRKHKGVGSNIMSFCARIKSRGEDWRGKSRDGVSSIRFNMRMQGEQRMDGNKDCRCQSIG